MGGRAQLARGTAWAKAQAGVQDGGGRGAGGGKEGLECKDEGDSMSLEAILLVQIKSFGMRGCARASGPGQDPWLAELLLEIFIDQVKFVVILKFMQFLLGKKEGERERGREKGRE
jgi:hypothetical protein